MKPILRIRFIKKYILIFVMDKTNFCLKSRNLSLMVCVPGSAWEEHIFYSESRFIRIHYRPLHTKMHTKIHQWIKI